MYYSSNFDDGHERMKDWALAYWIDSFSVAYLLQYTLEEEEEGKE